MRAGLPPPVAAAQPRCLKTTASRPDALVLSRGPQYLAQVAPPAQGGQGGAAGAQPQAAPEIKPIDDGKLVRTASGKLPNGITVAVYRDATLGTKINGEFERNRDGSVRETAGVIQIGAYSADTSAMHWVQFYKQSEYDANGKTIGGGSVAEGKSVYHENGKWHVDMPLPPIHEKPDPNAIYYDYKPSGNLAANSGQAVVMYDQPTEGQPPHGPRVRRSNSKRIWWMPTVPFGRSVGPRRRRSAPRGSERLQLARSKAARSTSSRPR